MLAQQIAPASQAGEACTSPQGTAPTATYSVLRHDFEPEAGSINDLVFDNDWLRPCDAVYVTEVRRHVLTDSDLNAAARALIGGTA